MKAFKNISLLTILLILFASFSFNSAQAQIKDTTKTKMELQTYTLKGKVINVQTTKAVSNATVSVNGREDSTRTDEKGMFELNDLKAGTYQIKVKADNYQSWSKSITIGKKIKQQLIKLKPAK